jgi:hypothetical protein
MAIAGIKEDKNLKDQWLRMLSDIKGVEGHKLVILADVIDMGTGQVHL